MGSSDKIELVIFDLDGTLLDTERLIQEVCKEVIEGEYRTPYTEEAKGIGIGKRPIEACEDLINYLDLPCEPKELLDKTSPLLEKKWAEVGLLPGALRLMRHLKENNVRMALATSSSQSSLSQKLMRHSSWVEYLEAIVSGDDVENGEAANSCANPYCESNARAVELPTKCIFLHGHYSPGKPAPDIFKLTAEKCGVQSSRCLVIEDSEHGVEAAFKANMKVIAVPSIRNRPDHVWAKATEIVPNLLEILPERYNLQPFSPRIADVVSLVPDDIVRVKGEVVRGFGRGSSELGIPTANLPAKCIEAATNSLATGIYIGWAGITDKGIYKMVMSVGWNPFYNNEFKTVEPHLIHDFGTEQLYGQELRLTVCGYIRPEANFESLQKLIERIKEDIRIAEIALDTAPFNSLKGDEFLVSGTLGL